jgi:hypothetical protein
MSRLIRYSIASGLASIALVRQIEVARGVRQKPAETANAIRSPSF